MTGFPGRRLTVRILAWCMPRIPAGQLRKAFDQSYRHRDEEWRQEVWRAAAERSARKAVGA